MLPFIRMLVLLCAMRPEVSAVTPTGSAGSDSPEKTAASACNDPIPKKCQNVQKVSEVGNCMCFACNPDTRDRVVVCTKDERSKKVLSEKIGGPEAGKRPQDGELRR
jgi:hypothetical protein